MKNFIFCSILLLLHLNTFAQEKTGNTKIVKTDNTIIEGKILNVGQTAIEFDPAGDIPFILIKRSDVKSIIYPDGTEVQFDSQASPAPATVQSAPAPVKPAEPVWNSYDTRNSAILDNSILSMCSAGGDVCYVGGIRGVSVYEKGQWSKRLSGAELGGYEFIGGIVSCNQKYYVGAADGGFAQFDGTKTQAMFAAELKGRDVLCLLSDGRKNVWIGTSAGLFCAVPDSMKINKMQTGDIPVKTLMVDNSGCLWIGTDGKGLMQLRGNEMKTLVAGSSQLPSNFIQVIKQDKDGKIWIATDGGGLGVTDGTNWTVYNASNSSLPSNFVTALEIDENGKKWIGTDGGGVGVFDGAAWKVYNSKNSKLLSDIIQCLYSSTGSGMWIGTAMGLTVIK